MSASTSATLLASQSPATSEATEDAANARDAAGVAITRDENVYLGGRLGPLTGLGPNGPLFRVTYQRQAGPPSN